MLKSDYEFPSPIDCDYKSAIKGLSDDGHIKTMKRKGKICILKRHNDFQ